MSTQIQLRKGTTAQHSTFTGALAEITVDTDKKVAVVHDGVTAGGVPLAKETHVHTGVYEPVDATILRSPAIGATVQGYDANIVKKNVANTFTAVQTPVNNTDTISTTSTYTFNGANQVREITLTAAITVTFGAPTGIVEDAMYKFKLKAGDTSARTFAWNTAYKFPAGVAPLTSGSITAGGKDIITFIGGPGNTLEYDGHIADVR